MNHKQSIVIIGGGSTGLSTALELAKNTKADITVVEKSFVGAGQTGQCCGLVRSFYNVPAMIISANYSMKKIKELCDKHKIFDYKKLGLLVIDSKDNSKLIGENVQLLQSLDVKARFLNGAQITKINPYIKCPNSIAGFDEEAFYVNPQLIIDYLKTECVNVGVKILEQTEVLSIKRKGRGFELKTDKGELGCQKLFNATAGYTNSINKMLNFELPVDTIRINNAFYRLPLGPNQYLNAIADFENCFYVIPHQDFIDVSSMTLDLRNTINPGTDKYIFDDNVIGEYLKVISRRISGAQKSAILGGFGSSIDITSDYYPILSSIDEIPNYYCAAGFSGTGFKHFPMISKLMSEIISDEKPTFPDLVKFFRYDRFKSQSLRQDVRDSYFVKK